MTGKDPIARAVTEAEMIAKELAAAKLSLRHARRCIKPAITEQTPITPLIKANINKKDVDVFPPKSSEEKEITQQYFKLKCSMKNKKKREGRKKHTRVILFPIDVFIKRPTS